jgi:hypothetical protein
MIKGIIFSFLHLNCHISGAKRFFNYSQRNYFMFTALINLMRAEIRVTEMHQAGNTKGGSITVPLTSCLTGLDYSVLQIKTKIVSCHTADSRPVKREVNSTVILPPLVFPASSIKM